MAGTPATDGRPTRSSVRVAKQAEAGDAGAKPATPTPASGKGKKRASAASEDTPARATRRRASGAVPGSAVAGEAEAPQGSPSEVTPSTPRNKKGRGRASGVTRFWRNNSSIAGRSALAPSKKKDFMQSGIYCQDPDPNSPRKLVNRVLSRRDAELAAARKRGRAAGAQASLLEGDRPQFPPMPYDYGEQHFFEQEHEFVLPYDIQWAAENGALDAKKRPTAFQRIRQNVFPERQKLSSDVVAICRCTKEAGCDTNCDNRIMHYTCGKDCPAGDACENKALWKQKQPNLKVAYTGQRGFGLFANQDISEGDFVIDYRGEIIALDTFYERCRNEYAASKNYYALAYDQDEVIDAAAKGNEARFINHGCQPNLEVRKVSSLGDGVEEFEVGMWAARDIKAGEELCYDYNFDSFAAADATECQCGAPNCVGYLGRKPGEKSAREKALEAELTETSRKAVKKQAKMAVKAAQKKASVKGKKMAPSAKASIKNAKGKVREAEVVQEREKRAKMRELRALKAHRAVEAAAEAHAEQTPKKGSMPPPELPATAGPSRRRRNEPASGRKPRASRAADGDSPLSDPDDEAARKEEARKRRISGWADWLKKKASEKSRTREEWQDFTNKRRRGKAWMESMMQEYGVAAYEGGPAEPYVSPMTDIPATGQPKRRGPPPGTPRAPRKPRVEQPVEVAEAGPSTTIDEADAERALMSIYPDFSTEGLPNLEVQDEIFDPATVDLANGVLNGDDLYSADFDQVAAEHLFGETSVDYFETQRFQAQRNPQESNARTEIEEPYSLAQVHEAVEAEVARRYQAAEPDEELRQRAMAIVSSIQPQVPQ